ncbi:MULTISPECIES: hypothetical protein [unclassified Sphingopyxis]|uniref:hypothetical protein n=1 Tax=unclassified Sphingopyxis TaxID=2614943 RepID=UPI00285D4163|nr:MULTISPECIES: hypothetical protein [unclassified Sphingopyxis]MDR6834311.1 uncharacterized protein YggT (Ycf19 family) [Sphingopyxis sp. BE122]MDR7226580.1 uncharacterized protein YggT (Ycf19 family) [Sphingopyxis sp. BE259]
MDDSSDNPGQAASSALLRALRPAMPAVIGAAALTFLFAAVMPMSWVAGIGWNLYLDRLSDYFVPPVGNAARLLLALGMAAIASMIAGLVALLIAQPDAAGLSALRDRFRRARDADAAEDAGRETDFSARRRRVDLHPDDPPRPPIRAGRDLPAGGLGPLTPATAEPGADLVAEPAAAQSADADLWLGEFAEQNADELVLADLAPADAAPTGDEPWLQPAEMTAPPLPAAIDNSLGAMVARLEAGLARRRETPGDTAATATVLAPDGSDVTAAEPEVDLALEAALSTLQRMTRQSVG